MDEYRQKPLTQKGFRVYNSVIRQLSYILGKEIGWMPRKRNEKLYLQTFRAVRAYIITHQLQAGDLLPTEQEMCQEFGVSRNVLREAITSMELMGMIEAVPGRGTTVKPFSLDFIMQNVLFFHVKGDERTVREMFSIRKVLELGYMREAFKVMTREDVAHIRAAMDRIRKQYEQAGLFAQADHDFHMAIFRPLNNTVLTTLMEAIWSVDMGFELEQKQPHLEDSVEKHEAITKALEDYNYMDFARAMERHYSSGKYTDLHSYTEF